MSFDNYDIADRAERSASSKIAEVLGIGMDELDRIDWEVVADQNKDGFIYGYYVNFTSDSDPDILERIGAEHDTVYLDHHVFDEPGDYDHYEEELIWERESDSHFSDFSSSVQHIRSLVNLAVPDSEKFPLLVMLYMHAASSFEHLLYRCFQHEVTQSNTNIKKFVETNPEFKKRIFTLDQIFATRDKLENLVAEYINEVIFHRIEKIVPMFHGVLGFKFGNCDWMAEAFLRRHDCAHRAGHTKGGDKLDLSKQMILELILRCEQFAQRLESHLLETRSSDRIEAEPLL